MENRIRQHIEKLFASAPDTAKTREVREDMIVNVIERYHDYIAAGKSPDEAYRASIGGIGDVSELINSLKSGASAQAAPARPAAGNYYEAQPGAAPAKKGLSTGAVVAIVICATILLLAIIGGIIAVRVTGTIFSGNGALSNIFGHLADNYSSEGTASFSFGSDDGFDGVYSASGSYSAAGVSALRIYWVSGSVSIKPAPAGTDEVTFFESSAFGISESTALRYKLTDGTLTVRCCSADIWKELDWSDIVHSDALPAKDLTVYVPEALARSMEITVGSVANTVLIEDLPAVSVNIDTVSGDCTFRGVTADTFKLNGVSCDAVFENCSGASLVCDLVSGRATVGGSFKKYKFDSVSGDVSVTFGSAPQSFSADTVSGSVALHGCSVFGFTAEFDSVSGEVTSALAMRQSGSKYVFGDGAAPFDIESVSGDLTID